MSHVQESEPDINQLKPDIDQLKEDMLTSFTLASYESPDKDQILDPTKDQLIRAMVHRTFEENEELSTLVEKALSLAKEARKRRMPQSD